MSATNVMKEDHGGIHLMIRIVESALTEHKEGGEEAFRTFSSIVEFFQVFADRCHHGKEEELLFPALTGNEEAEKIIEGLLVDHERGRKYVREMESSLASWKRGDDDGRDRFRSALTMYAKLLSEHIRREDEELWPVADAIIPVEEGKRLIAEFERVEREKIGEGKLEVPLLVLLFRNGDGLEDRGNMVKALCPCRFCEFGIHGRVLVILTGCRFFQVFRCCAYNTRRKGSGNFHFPPPPAS